jgi:hypothetical protein
LFELHALGVHHPLKRSWQRLELERHVQTTPIKASLDLFAIDGDIAWAPQQAPQTQESIDYRFSRSVFGSSKHLIPCCPMILCCRLSNESPPLEFLGLVVDPSVNVTPELEVDDAARPGLAIPEDVAQPTVNRLYFLAVDPPVSHISRARGSIVHGRHTSVLSGTSP